MNRLYMVLGVLGVLGVALIGYAIGSKGEATVSPIAVDGLDDLDRLVELAQGQQKGKEDARLTVIEFGDFQCPSCGAFATQVEPRVDEVYVETGKAKFVFYDWPITSLHRHAFLAARAARCAADQGAFWPYHDALYQNQATWASLDDPVDALVDFADALGLGHGAFAACLNSDRFADVVTANMELGNQLGVDRTPTIIIENGGAIHAVPPSYGPISAYLEGILAAENAP